MSDRLSFLDTMFLELEQADASAHMHIGAALLFDPLPGGGHPTLEEMRAQTLERLPLLPRYMQKLSEPTTAALAWRSWEPAHDFDIASHLRQATLPAPGGRAELEDWLGDFWSHRLDRHRPLWENVLLDGFADGSWAIASKTHHCLVDGVGSWDIGYALLDTEPEPRAFEVPRVDGANGKREPGFWLTPGRAARGAATVGGLLRRPKGALEVAGTIGAMLELLVREEIMATAQCSLNGPMSASRRFATLSFALEDIKAVKRARGGTVNDVVLALCTGGLRELLLSRGEEPPERGLRAEIPVNLRVDETAHTLGNELTSLFCELPIAEPDPHRRYRKVMAAAEGLKGSRQPVAGHGLVVLSNAMPPAFGARLGRMLFNDVRAFNLTITNVPGPQFQLYGGGARLREILPLVPLFNGHRVGIAAISYNGQVVFGINADRLHVPDLEVLSEGIMKSYGELRPRPPTRRRRASGPREATAGERGAAAAR